VPTRKTAERLRRRIGARIEAVREEKGLTAEKVAAYGDLSKSHLSRTLRGQNLPSLWKLEQIARGLDVELLDLVNDPSASLRGQLVDATRSISEEGVRRLLAEARRYVVPPEQQPAAAERRLEYRPDEKPPPRRPRR
jgi:transcriptional regulator with XRE-family HTH domain